MNWQYLGLVVDNSLVIPLRAISLACCTTSGPDFFRLLPVAEKVVEKFGPIILDIWWQRRHPLATSFAHVKNSFIVLCFASGSRIEPNFSTIGLQQCVHAVFGFVPA